MYYTISLAVCVGLFFILIFKESWCNMAKAKYKRQANGYFQAFVWDGTYRNGAKHYVTLRSKVSSAALENW